MVFEQTFEPAHAMYGQRNFQAVRMSNCSWRQEYGLGEIGDRGSWGPNHGRSCEQ